MANRRRSRYARLYGELWRLYYVIIVLGSGVTIAGISTSRHDYIFAGLISVLTVAAVAALMFFTFRRRKTGAKVGARRQMRSSDR